jgi:hypothetical protein
MNHGNRLFYYVPDLAALWGKDEGYIINLGETGQLKFAALTDWYFPDYGEWDKLAITNVTDEELGMILNHPEASFVVKNSEADIRLFGREACGTQQDHADKPWIKKGALVEITYWTGTKRLIIHASEVDRYLDKYAQRVRREELRFSNNLLTRLIVAWLDANKVRIGDSYSKDLLNRSWREITQGYFKYDDVLVSFGEQSATGNIKRRKIILDGWSTVDYEWFRRRFREIFNVSTP